MGPDVAHMLFARISTAVREAYAARDDVDVQLAAARAQRAWIESLELDPATQAGLAEPIAAVEDGLREVLRRRSAAGGPPGASGPS